MKMAVVSTDGVNVNDHFGKAERFLIYEAGGAAPKLLEERSCKPLSTGDPGHSFDEQRFGALTAALEGCAKVYCTKIGEVPAAKLRERGVEPVIYEGPIEKMPMN